MQIFWQIEMVRHYVQVKRFKNMKLRECTLLTLSHLSGWLSLWNCQLRMLIKCFCGGSSWALHGQRNSRLVKIFRTYDSRPSRRVLFKLKQYLTLTVQPFGRWSIIKIPSLSPQQKKTAAMTFSADFWVLNFCGHGELKRWHYKYTCLIVWS